jgi:hypothetical protein
VGRRLAAVREAPTLEATFASIQENVFTPICTAGHVGAAAPQGLRLDEANNYAPLVGRPKRVHPAGYWKL